MGRHRNEAIIIPKSEKSYAKTLSNVKKQLEAVKSVAPIKTIKEARTGDLMVKMLKKRVKTDGNPERKQDHR